MEIHALFGKIAGLLSFAAFIPYIYSILKGRAKPNRATWIIWAVMGYVLGASYYVSGARDTMWVPLAYAIGPTITALLSIKYGEGGWTRFDRFCLASSGVSILLWIITGQPMVALIINIFIDLFGAMPTIKKAYNDPASEDRLTWILFGLGNFINLFAITEPKFSIMVYPIYMFICCNIITVRVAIPKSKAR